MKIKPLIIQEKYHAAIKKTLLRLGDVQIAGCWIWNGTSRNGYGCISIPGKTSSQWVHRVSYAVFVGPILEDHVIDHRCRCRLCFNPEHLQMVTHSENCKAIYRRQTRDVQYSIFDLVNEISIFDVVCTK